ncbi:hypothetical protein KUCAC02_031697 [Chaenocephalus aceratus]|nr:hypothetical protein KUCAC02_031697 [Chaenocephalus aceratus]
MKREGKRAHLTIHGLTGIDAGQYRCMAGGSQSTAHLNVEVRTLKLVKHLAPVEIEEEGNATFSCELNYVVANVEWLLNNVRLYCNAINRIQHMGTMHSLTFKRLRPQESKVTFKTGLLSETTTLNVKERPAVFLRSLEDVVGEEQGEFGKSMAMIIHSLSKEDAGLYTCDLGTSQTKAKVTVHGEICTFECNLSHNVDEEPFWTINGQVVVTDSRLQVINNGRNYKMTIRDAMLTDAGDVVFTIKDLSCRTMLFVKEKPVHIFRDLLNVKAGTGEDAELSLLLRGRRHATRAKLDIRELQHTFARELRETRAEEKGKVTLDCETRQPAKRVTWLKGMVELRSGRKYVIRQKGVLLSLTITCLETSDMNSRAQLTVQGQKVLILDELEDVECLETDTVTFRCRICPSDYIGVKWYLDETLLYTNDLNEIQMLPEDTTPSHLDSSPAKTPAPSRLQRGTKDRTPRCWLERGVQPLLKRWKTARQLKEGGRGHILWYKDGCLMWNSSRYASSRSGCEARLTVREVCNSDAGVYECSAGSVTTRAVVTVRAIPAEFTQGLEPVEAREGGDERRREPQAFRPGPDETEEDPHHPHHQSLRPADSGEYTCQCRDHRTTASLKVQAIPITFVQQLKSMQAEEGNNVLLRCELSKPGVPVEWNKGHELLKNGVKHQMKRRDSMLELLIWKAVPEDSGLYSCVCADQRTSATVKINGRTQNGKVSLV